MNLEELLAKVDELAKRVSGNAVGSYEHDEAEPMLAGLSPDLARRLKKAMEAIGLLTSNGDPCEICYEAGCTGNSSCFDCRDGGDLTCHDRAYARKQKASALIREIKGSE